MAADWKGILKSVAPGIATAIGGPLAGMAVAAIGNALGVDQPTQEKVQEALAGATPDDLLKLKQAEQDFQAKMKQADIDLERIAESDRDSARKREVDTKDRTPAHLAYIVILGFFGVSSALIAGFMLVPDTMGKIPAQGWVLIGSIYGYLANEAKQAGAYYWGSSVGSKDKDATLAEIAKQT